MTRVHWVNLGRTDSLESWDNRETRAIEVSSALQVLKDPQERKEIEGFQVPQERRPGTTNS